MSLSYLLMLHRFMLVMYTQFRAEIRSDRCNACTGLNPIEGSLAATHDVEESSRHDSQLQARSP